MTSPIKQRLHNISCTQTRWMVYDNHWLYQDKHISPWSCWCSGWWLFTQLSAWDTEEHHYRSWKHIYYTSEAIHHGQKVITFAARTWNWLFCLSELPHDLCQFCTGLTVLKNIEDDQWGHEECYPISLCFI